MQAIAEAVDGDVLATAVQNAARKVEASDETAAKPIKDIAKVGSYLDFAGVPVQNRRLVLNPAHKVTYAMDDNMSKVAYAGDSKALRDAELGRIYTMDTYMSQNAPYPYGYLDKKVGTAKSFKVSGIAGESKVSLTALNTASATVKVGDCFIVEGYVYHIVKDYTGASSAIAEGILEHNYPNNYSEKAYWSMLHKIELEYDLKIKFLSKANMGREIYTICRFVLESYIER